MAIRRSGRFSKLVADRIGHPERAIRATLSSALTAILLNLFGAAELQTCEPAGFDFGNAGSHLVGDLRFDVKLDFPCPDRDPCACARIVSAASS